MLIYHFSLIFSSLCINSYTRRSFCEFLSKNNINYVKIKYILRYISKIQHDRIYYIYIPEDLIFVGQTI